MTQLKRCINRNKVGVKEFLGRAKKYTLEHPKLERKHLREFISHYGITDVEAQNALCNMADNYRALFGMIQNCLIATNGNPTSVNIVIVSNIQADKFI
jgi:hypothetical protein